MDDAGRLGLQEHDMSLGLIEVVIGVLFDTEPDRKPAKALLNEEPWFATEFTPLDDAILRGHDYVRYSRRWSQNR